MSWSEKKINTAKQKIGIGKKRKTQKGAGLNLQSRYGRQNIVYQYHQ
jgi:hypothetical protein